MFDSLDTLIAFTLIMLVVSLLITIAVQMVSSLLNLRGWNLYYGLWNSLETILPGRKEDAKKIIDNILKDPMISDSSFIKLWPGRWRLASAVRSDEIFDAIHRIAIGKADLEDPKLQKYARDLLIALGINKDSIDEASETIKSARETLSEANGVIQALAERAPGELQSWQCAVSDVAARLNAFAAAGATLARSGTIAAGAIDNAYQKFQYWCDISQERVQQWFAMHTRMVTVAFAVIFAFALQLDAVEIYKFVSTNRTARDKLVAQASTVASQAEKILSDSPNVLKEALDKFKEKQTDAVRKALVSVSEEGATRGSLSEKVNDEIAKLPEKDRQIQGDLESVIDETVTTHLKNQAGNFMSVKASIDKTGFNLLPSGQAAKGNGWRWGEKYCENLTTGRFLGILFTAALLSLGAPFWYNILKNLTSLRSTVAGNISNEQKEVKKLQAAATENRAAPPTVAPPK